MDTPLNDQDRIMPTGERPVKPDNSAEQLLSPKDERIVSASPSPDAAIIAPSKDVTEQPDSVDSGDLGTGCPLNAYASHEQNPSYGYGNSTATWDRYSQYLNADGLHMSPVIYNDNTSLSFHSGYGFNPEIAYGQYSPVPMPLPPIMAEGQLYSPQQIPFSPNYFPQAGPPNVPSAVPVSPTELIVPESSGDNLLFGPGSGYFVHYGSFGGGNASGNLGSSPLTSPAGYPQPVGILGSYEQNVGQISQQGPFNGFGLGSSSSPGSYPQGGPYQNSYFGSNDCIRPAHDKGRRQERDQDSICISNDSHGIDRNRGPRASKMKGKSTSEQSSLSGNSKNNSSGSRINLHLYNQPHFVTEYENAKFFVIKSFSEDNVHKSIKYKVWASTPHGNKKLDAAYHEAKGTSAPVFLLFSVNASGQFCGVAEMIGPVDFEKDADYWQQDRWSGQFPVKWHIIKDVPNSRFRHLLLENNDNKPVTHSRDSQEVKLEQGIEMLKIFKDHDARTCILVDFDFYDERERTLKERRARQQASSTKGAPDLLADNTVKLISDSFTQALQVEDGGKETPASDTIVFSTQDVLVSLAKDSISQTSGCFSVAVESEKINKEIPAAETGAEHQN